MTFAEGTFIGIPCKVFPGAFPREAMVIIETRSGEVSGFVNRNELISGGEEVDLLRGRIVDVSEDAVSVQLRGSFFTTTGFAEFSPEWAKSNARVLAA